MSGADNISAASLSLSPSHHLANTGHYIQTLSRVSHAKSYLSHYLYDLKTILELILRDTNGLHVCNIILGSGALAEKSASELSECSDEIRQWQAARRPDKLTLHFDPLHVSQGGGTVTGGSVTL